MWMGIEVRNIRITAVIMIFVGIMDNTVKIFQVKGHAGKIVILQHGYADESIAVTCEYAAEAAPDGAGEFGLKLILIIRTKAAQIIGRRLCLVSCLF